MKMPHVLRVEEDAGAFAKLIDAAGEAGLRVGWLELGAEPEVPDGLAAAATLGVARAVLAGSARTVSLKPRRGEPVLRDLIREHFLGCRLLLVHGEVEAALLTPEGERWRFAPLSGRALSWRLEELLQALRRPRLPGHRDPSP